MTMAGGFLARKLHRAFEALDLISRYSADMETRRKMIGIYASLSDRSRYDDEVTLKLRVRNRTFPFVMRVSDIFIVAEILHEKQYRMQSYVPLDGTIIDAGGNIGVSMVWFLAQYPQADIHIFEPADENLHFLSRNAAPWRQVTLSRSALARESGELNLYHGEFGGMHSTLHNPDVDVSKAEPVVAIALADYLDDQAIATIDLLKLDIEGGEIEALHGLGSRVCDVNVIVGEVHEKIIDTAEFYDLLAQAGFEILWTRQFRDGAAQGEHGFEAVRPAAA
jgi:FkbM family methyltransferase